MHISFDLVRLRCESEEEEKWYIHKQEDVIQPLILFLAIPGVAILGRPFYACCEIMDLLSAWVSMLLGM
jgi:hypothetical protein